MSSRLYDGKKGALGLQTCQLPSTQSAGAGDPPVVFPARCRPEGRGTNSVFGIKPEHRFLLNNGGGGLPINQLLSHQGGIQEPGSAFRRAPESLHRALWLKTAVLRGEPVLSTVTQKSTWPSEPALFSGGLWSSSWRRELREDKTRERECERACTHPPLQRSRKPLSGQGFQTVQTYGCSNKSRQTQ